MKRLLLLRHAKSSWSDPDLPDHARPLAPRGRRDARAMGEHLAGLPFPVDQVICSSAVRAQETLSRLGLPRGTEVRTLDGLYLPSLAELVSALAQAAPSARTLLVVAHSPVLDAFVLTHAKMPIPLRARLLDRFPTGALAVLEFPLGDWSELSRRDEPPRPARLVHFTAPGDLAEPRTAPLAPARGERVTITPHTRLTTLASRAFESAVDQLRENTGGAGSADDPEFRHLQRVAVRKLRVLVRLFSTLLGEARAEHLSGELRWLFRLLGAVREYEVLGASRAAALRERGRAGAALQKALDASEAEARADLARALASPRYLRLVRDLVALEAELARRDDGPRARTFLAKKLTKRARRVKHHRKAARAGGPSELHTLRKELKKLRYTAELARGAFPSKRLARFLRALEVLQDELGAYNDEVSARTLVARTLDALPTAQARTLRQALDAADLPTPDALARLPALRPFWR